MHLSFTEINKCTVIREIIYDFDMLAKKSIIIILFFQYIKYFTE